MKVKRAVVRCLVRPTLVPAYMFATPFARLGLWLLGWSLTVASFGAWALPGEGSRLWQAATFAFASGGCHWARVALPHRL
jgi:hypothetical protein